MAGHKKKKTVCYSIGTFWTEYVQKMQMKIANSLDPDQIGSRLFVQTCLSKYLYPVSSALPTMFTLFPENRKSHNFSVVMKLGSKHNSLNILANYRNKTDPMKALGRIDFTKYALSTINYLMQSSQNGQVKNPVSLTKKFQHQTSSCTSSIYL